MINVLILGSNSFIGSHLAATIAAGNNASLTVFGRTAKENLPAGVKFIRGDYTDREQLGAALKGQDLVYHFISQSYPFSTWENPVDELDRNIRPFIQFIELCYQSGVKKIAYISSGGAMYGPNETAADETTPPRPYTPYGISKLYMENLLGYGKVKYRIAYDIYRISNVYGDNQVTQKGLGFIHAAVESALKGTAVTVYGDGVNTRDYIYIDDVSRLLMLSIVKPIDHSDIYNLCSNESVSLLSILDIMREKLGLTFTVEYKPGRQSDATAVCLTNKKLLTLFPGYQLTSLEEGIRKVYHSLSKQQLS